MEELRCNPGRGAAARLLWRFSSDVSTYQYCSRTVFYIKSSCVWDAVAENTLIRTFQSTYVSHRAQPHKCNPNLLGGCGGHYHVKVDWWHVIIYIWLSFPRQSALLRSAPSGPNSDTIHCRVLPAMPSSDILQWTTGVQSRMQA